MQDWKLLRFSLFQALDTVDVKEIYLIEKENNVLRLCLVVNGLEKIRPLVKLNIIDKLVEKNAPELYSAYLFQYDVWEEKDWLRQKVADVFRRREYRIYGE